MPSWKVHLIFNFLILVVWIKFLLTYGLVNDYSLLGLMIFFSSFLSIFPDIDCTKSGIRTFLAVLLASVIIIYFFLVSVLNSIISLLFSFTFLFFLFKFFPTEHRGITHTFWFSISFSFLITLILWISLGFSSHGFLIYFFLLLTGYLSHIFLDAIT